MSEMVFDQEALEANRGGGLSPGQLNQLQDLMAKDHKGLMGRVGRRLDPVASDVEGRRVEMIEGSVTKRTRATTAYIDNESSPLTYEIHVASRQAGDKVFESPQDVYEAAPGIGTIRLFYLPRSRRVVNFEILSAPADTDTSTQGTAQNLRDWGLAALKHDTVGAAEARARLAAIGGDVSRYLPDEAPRSFVPSEPGSLASAIVGAWAGQLLSVTFVSDGRLTAQIVGEKEHAGTWSMDAEGQLHSDVMGSPITAEASIVDNELTLVINGRAITMRRTEVSP